MPDGAERAGSPKGSTYSIRPSRANYFDCRLRRDRGRLPAVRRHPVGDASVRRRREEKIAKLAAFSSGGTGPRCVKQTKGAEKIGKRSRERREIPLARALPPGRRDLTVTGSTVTVESGSGLGRYALGVSGPSSGGGPDSVHSTAPHKETARGSNALSGGSPRPREKAILTGGDRTKGPGPLINLAPSALLRAGEIPREKAN